MFSVLISQKYFNVVINNFLPKKYSQTSYHKKQTLRTFASLKELNAAYLEINQLNTFFLNSRFMV